MVQKGLNLIGVQSTRGLKHQRTLENGAERARLGYDHLTLFIVRKNSENSEKFEKFRKIRKISKNFEKLKKFRKTRKILVVYLTSGGTFGDYLSFCVTKQYLSNLSSEFDRWWHFW